MGYKSKATKKNKEKKQDRAPIKRKDEGITWAGMATHKHISEWSNRQTGKKEFIGGLDLGFDKSVETGVMVERTEKMRRRD